jgi:hypothetical protein
MEIRNEKGELHNLDGPAYINADIKAWYINGKRHREDGPAIIEGDYKVWYINNKLHREDGPAVIEGDYKVWYINGKRHREDGPAVIDKNNKEWFINDIKRDEEWVKRYLKIKNKHLLLGVIVSDKWRIREIILRWRYDPKFKCVKNRIKRKFNNLYNLINN